MKRIFRYLKASWREIRKVKWPTKKQAAKLTFAVIMFSLFFAAFTGIVDAGIDQFIEKVILK